MKLKIYFFLCLVFIVLFTDAQNTGAELNVPGSLDSSFGNNGKVFLEGVYASANCVALQKDGKIIQGGNALYEGVLGAILVRYNTNGTIDSSFGNKGIVVTALPGHGYSSGDFRAIGVQKDNKIIAMSAIDGAYSESQNIAVLRYMPNGTLDSSFGENGMVITDIKFTDIPNAMIVQNDDKIVVTGTTLANYNDDQTSFTVRYLENGTLDSSFGGDGIVLTVYQQPIEISSVALGSDGKVVIGGEYALLQKPVFVRYMSDGRKDVNFGTNGIAVISFSNPIIRDYIRSIAVQDDGKILSTGVRYEDVISNMVLFRIDNGGKLDSSFAGTGVIVQDFGDGSSEATKVLIQQDGKVIISGKYYYTFFAVARYNQNGSLDSSFGSNGLVTTDLSYSVYFTSAALQSDNKLVMSGSVYIEETDISECALARYNGDPTLISLAKNIKVSEGSTGYTNAVFHVELNNTSSLPVKAKYRTVNGTAKAGIDYVADSGVVTIQPGRIMKKITIEVIGDNIQEANKKFYLQIGEPVNAKLGALSVASCTIKNDDALRTGYNNLTLPAIKIFPNPVKDVLQLQGLDAGSNATVTIVNLQGAVIDASVVSNSSSYTKNISQLQHGTYYIKIQQKEKVSTVMFMKE